MRRDRAPTQSARLDGRTATARAVRQQTRKLQQDTFGGFASDDPDAVTRAAELLEMARHARERALKGELDLATVVRIENMAQRALRDLQGQRAVSKTESFTDRIAALKGRDDPDLRS